MTLSTLLSEENGREKVVFVFIKSTTEFHVVVKWKWEAFTGFQLVAVNSTPGTELRMIKTKRTIDCHARQVFR